MQQNFKVPPTAQTYPAGGIQSFPGTLDRINPRWRLIGGALLAAAILGLVWWLTHGTSGTEAHRIPLPPVLVAKAQTRTVPVNEQTIGTVLANNTVQITSRVEGQLLTANFHEGQIVHEGDVLFQIDPKPFQAALEQAQAALARDRAQLASAANDAKRYASLAAQGAASASQRDQFVAQAKALTATVKSDEAAVDLARMNLDYTTIKAPVSGKTGSILIQPGNLVKANDTNAMMVLNQIQPVKVTFSLPQTDLPRIQDEMRNNTLTVRVQVHGGAGPSETAPVDFVGNAINAQTGTIELRATFNNADFRLVPGELVDVVATLNTLHNAVTVPHEAVNLGENGQYVYVVSAKGTAEMRPVKVLFDDGKSAAISGNVKPGDRVITDGQLRVVPGKPVTVQKQAGKRA